MAGNEPRDDLPPRDQNDAPQAPEPAAWETRRDTLSERIAAQRSRMALPETGAGRSSGMRGAAEGLKMASEFVAGILVGAGIGYLLDLLAGTNPFGLIFFLLVGFAAGVVNVLRAVSRTPGSPPSSDWRSRK